MKYRFFVFIFGLALACQAQTNLIVNGNMATHSVSSSVPDHWNQGWWGNTTPPVFNYPVNCGSLSTTAASITLSNWTAGDAKWYPDDVPVTPGASYTFSDVYMSDVQSAIDMRYTLQDGSFVYPRLATLPATGGACLQSVQTTVAPANAVSLTTFHSASSNGTLVTGNYSLAPASGGGTNTFPKGIVSLTLDDNWLSQLNAKSILDTAKIPATFYIISWAMQNANEIIFPSANNPMNAIVTPKKTTWPNIYTDPTKHDFIFTDTYTATVPGTIVFTYKLANGNTGTTSFQTAAGTNVAFSASFNLPALGGPITIVQQVPTGTLSATNPLLTEPLGYMDATQVLSLQNAGYEVGNHTEHHPNLGVMQTNPNADPGCDLPCPGPITVSSEVGNAETALLSVGMTPVDTFAYPHGNGATNPAVQSIIQGAGIKAARSIDPGYNTKASNKYDLLSMIVDRDTTVATVKGWIDYAAANNVWLILTFHQVETTAGALKNEQYGTTTAIFQKITDYLVSKQANGVIMVDTVHNVIAKYY